MGQNNILFQNKILQIHHVHQMSLTQFRQLRERAKSYFHFTPDALNIAQTL